MISGKLITLITNPTNWKILFTDRDFEIIFVVENENEKSIPLTPLISELKGLFQFCLIYRYIFHKTVSEKLITLITNPRTGNALYR